MPASRQFATQPQCDVPMLRVVIPDPMPQHRSLQVRNFHSALPEALVLERYSAIVPNQGTSRAQWIQGQSQWATPSDSQRLDPSIISANDSRAQYPVRAHSYSSQHSAHSSTVALRQRPTAWIDVHPSTFPSMSYPLLAPSHSMR